MIDRTTHRKAYDKWLTKRWDSKQRNIEFNLTFTEWYNWWLSNGIDKNIESNHSMCMCRKGDVGPYSLDNIYFATRATNTSHARQNKPRSQKGELNPMFGRCAEFNTNSRKIQTPFGTFASLNSAAEFLQISGEGVRGRIKRKPQEYSYID
jgi:hypothetical protein